VVSEGLGGGYLNGHIDKKMLRAYLPDYSRRLFYISGPQAFVAAVRLSLLELGVQPKNITTDFFPGYN
jgi:ferredoxin-NADP reductase